MAQLESTARSRELGEELREHRERAGLRANELAKALGWHPSKVSRIESGLQWPSETDVAMVLAYCRVDAKDIERIRRIHSHVDTSIWILRAPENLRTLARLENNAGRVRGYEPQLVPGLLQTESYARALFKDAMIGPDSVVEQRVRARMARQSIHDREIQPQMEFFIHEQVLHNIPASDPKVMSEQLLRMTLLTVNHNCTIRVIPRMRCAQGVFGTSFRLMDFASHRPVGYCDQPTTSCIFERKDDVDFSRSKLSKMSELALDKHESRELLASLANYYG